ncbi:MAG: hypothetical protein PHY09_01250 [Desulfuromonadaceae bacterium]|nr:hypothetical protein [Desulfuromonadaceae bacterium]MDD5104942.1 hypothetical protein [Desulfuromonadaceae bacterium]
MPQTIDDLIRRIKDLQEELEVEFKKKRNEFEFIIEEKRVRFAEEVARQQRRLKIGWFRYLIKAKPLNVLTAPFIYAGFIPFILLDLFLWLYQSICFPVYRIPKVKRSEYLIFDREDLPYLNFIEKFNCFYCSYGNGLMSYGREIAARTEQYWCPIKHARRITAAHEHYPRFFEYGDAESWQKGLERLRRQYPSENNSEKR